VAVGPAATAPSGNAALTLAAMTLSSSMILVDQTAVPLATADVLADLGGAVGEGQWILTANILPLAALMVFGGRLGDLLGLRRVFLAGALMFVASTAVAGGAQDMPMMIAARAVQGAGAALMMPTAVAITSAVFPRERRGRALGILAGGSAFFAALGPVLGGLLTSIDWRLVFLVNVPLAAITVVLTLWATPPLRAQDDTRPRIDYPGTITFGLGIAALVFGLSQGQADGWGSPSTVIPLVAAVAVLASFVLIELRTTSGLLDFRLFRHLNFLAANLSQLLAGMIELGLGFLLPFYLLLVIGISPATAGIALIPATIPIILAGPLAGRAFDRVGGRIPLVAGYLLLAASGLALAAGVGEQTVAALIPGFALQGLGLGVVLTVNDPTGLGSVPPDAQGTAAGTINTTEQLGGALGIAGLAAIEVGASERITYERLADRGIDPSPEQVDEFKEYILQAEQAGRGQTAVDSQVVRVAIEDNVLAHVDSFRITFLTSVGIAMLGAVVCFVLVRRDDRFYKGPVFGRRSRWLWANVGASPGVTRHPPRRSDG
jgi:EmrB/QacA subfamily drug resistance transporter